MYIYIYIYNYPPLGKSRSRVPIKKQPTSRDLLLKLRSLSGVFAFLGFGSFFATVSGFALQNPIYFSTPSSDSLLHRGAGSVKIKGLHPQQFPLIVGAEGSLSYWEGRALSAQEISQERSNPNLLQGTYFSNCVP